MTEEEKIATGSLYSPADPALKAIKLRTHNLNVAYNQTYEDDVATRERIITAIVGDLGEQTFFQGPIAFHYGSHTKIGKRCFFNFNFTVQDDAQVTIGDDCSFGPNVTIVTPLHPLVASERKEVLTAQGERKGMCYAKPVTIGDNCWFGANVTVCPGVTIGDACVIGAGSVVTRDIPSGTLAAGVPCRVIRVITEADSLAHQPLILADNQLIASAYKNEGTANQVLKEGTTDV